MNAPLINSTETPTQGLWFRAAKEMRKDLWFFGGLGLALGIIQKVGYDHLDGANVGSDLLQEHIPFNTLLSLTMLIWALKGLCLLPRARTIRWVEAMIAQVETRVLAFGSVATLTTFGFALSAFIFGGYPHAVIFLVVGAFFGAVTEVAISPAKKSELHRRGFIWALTLVYAVPLSFQVASLVKWALG